MKNSAKGENLLNSSFCAWGGGGYFIAIFSGEGATKEGSCYTIPVFYSAFLPSQLLQPPKNG